MSFQPIIPSSGLVGWKLLNRTLPTQMAAFENSAVQQRDTAYFREKIATVVTAEQLVQDNRLLRVSLQAFGLQDDLPNRYFIQEILSQGTTDRAALANRLADERYAKFSEAFGFGELGIPNTLSPDFADNIIEKFNRSSFEASVGDQDEDLRLALYASRELDALAQEGSSNDTKWLLIMGTPPLRKVFETAFNLPTSFGQLDLDRQLDVFQSKAEQRLSTRNVSDFDSTELREDLIEQFLLQSQLKSNASYTGMSVALQLLQGVS